MPFISDRSIISPSSIVARPATLWPPPRTATSRPGGPRELDGVDDVGQAEAPRDHGRTLVHEPVVHLASVFVGEVERLKQLAANDGASWLSVAATVMGASSETRILASPQS